MAELTNEDLRERLGELAQRIHKLEQNFNLFLCVNGILWGVVIIILIL